MSEKHLPFQLKASTATSHLDYICNLDVNSEAAETRLTGIICTIGPASRDPAFLVKMMETGMNVARLNFSHGSHEYHAESIANIRKAVEDYSKKIGTYYPLAIALDTKGPEIRTGLLEGGGSAEIELKRGDPIKITTDKAYESKGNKECIYIDYDNIQKVVKPGHRIFIDDGLMSVMIESVQGSFLNCIVENGGRLGSRKGCNLPGVAIDLPAVSEKDKSDLKFGVEQGVDMIFASFIRNGGAVSEIRAVLGDQGKEIMIISKIESTQGVHNIDEIVEASDGVMVARGDLGIEIPTEKVFIAQKSILAKCNRMGKPGICATQMLESMIYKPRPTRAESSDVANAVLDGSDCVMLSGETAKGDYPLECIAVMSDISREAEAVVWHRQFLIDLSNTVIPPVELVHTVAISVVEAAAKSFAAAIVVVTTSGKSAYLISKFKPHCPIIAVTRRIKTARQAQLYRAVIPLYFDCDRTDDWMKDVESRIHAGIKFGKGRGFIRSGDPIVVVTGWKQGTGFTNTMRLIYVSDEVQSICLGPCS